MANYWCVNFETIDCLHHGIRNECWVMGYQFAKGESDSPGRKSSITRNWTALSKIEEGDKFVAFSPGNKYFAIGTAIPPTRPAAPKDTLDSILAYLKRKASYTKGYVYFPPSLAYENFTDGLSEYPVRVDVDAWDYFAPHGVQVSLPPLPRHRTVYAAIAIDQDRFEAIRESLSKDQRTDKPTTNAADRQAYSEGASSAVTINTYQRSRKARAKCIEHHGWNCAVCGYNMAELYGRLGEGVIHVHHLREISSKDGEYLVDPVKDLRPVCPNCHAVLHSSYPAISINKLKATINKREHILWPKREN